LSSNLAAVPSNGPLSGSPLSSGHILQMVRDGAASSRADIAKATGLARSTVSQRVEPLLASGLLVEEEAESTGGRPPTLLRFNAGLGVVLAADLGATHARAAVTDLDGVVLAEEAADMSISLGPDVVLQWAIDHFRSLLGVAGRGAKEVRGIGIGVPGPVEFAMGRAVAPPIMPGWDGVSIPQRLNAAFPGVPVLVDNDVNVMAVGEHWANWRSVSDLMFVKVATGIGAGLIINGHVHRGAQGAAGDMGHIRASDDPAAVCKCGNVGCVEAVASGSALARQLTLLGISAVTTRDVVALVRAGNADAVRLVREAGRHIGVVVSEAVNLLNPSVVVIGGDLAKAQEHLFAGIREVVYRRSTPLATNRLEIVRPRLDDRSGVTGAAVTVLQQILSPAAVDAAIESRAGEVA
jgi:predicted NBD/HSP70 family sugar kinase